MADSRLSPLDTEHRQLGAKLVDFGGWEMPLSYPQGTVAEHEACRTSAVAFDVSHLGTVRVKGSDAFKRLQRALTNDLGKIAPGRAQYTHLLGEDASVLDDIIVWWIDEETFDVMPNAANTSHVTDAIGGVDVTHERAIIAIQGPDARKRVHDIASDIAEIPHFGVRQVEWRGAKLSVGGTGYTGEDGVEVAVPADVAGSFWRELLDAGTQPAGLGARDTLRLEAGLPLHGHELGPGITSLQAGLGWVVAWDKGDFRGREALSAERERGVSRRLRGLVTEGRQPPRSGNRIISEGSSVGEVTSGNFSPVLGSGIALGFVSPEMQFDTPVVIDIRGRAAAAKIVKTPFVQRPPYFQRTI